ncbi:MAG TPA: hypothetical protein VLK33_02630 [Terriglobales bacterium]|nr:hypothetical protein [Terriglobales bacterium]
MKRRSPTLEGFKVIFRRPSLGMGEISWRWSFGAGATALLCFSFLEYLDTLPVSNRELLLLRSRQPALVSKAFSHILSGSGPRFMVASLLLILTITLAWVVIGSLGRAATLKGLLSYFWADDASKTFPFRMKALYGLNFLRAGATLAVIVGSVGAMVLGGMASSKKDPSPGLAFLIFLAVATMAWLAWSVMNWVLSVASVFVVTNNADTLGAIGDAVGMLREHFGAVWAVSTWFGLAHVVAISVASSVIVLPLAFVGLLPRGLVFLAILLIAMLYFAVVDLLYLGRLGSLVWIVEGRAIEPEPILVRPLPLIPPSYLGPSGDRVDPDDLILSDIPVS